MSWGMSTTQSRVRPSFLNPLLPAMHPDEPLDADSLRRHRGLAAALSSPTEKQLRRHHHSPQLPSIWSRHLARRGTARRSTAPPLTKPSQPLRLLAVERYIFLPEPIVAIPSIFKTTLLCILPGSILLASDPAEQGAPGYDLPESNQPWENYRTSATTTGTTASSGARSP